MEIHWASTQNSPSIFSPEHPDTLWMNSQKVTNLGLTTESSWFNGLCCFTVTVNADDLSSPPHVSSINNMRIMIVSLDHCEILNRQFLCYQCSINIVIIIIVVVFNHVSRMGLVPPLLIPPTFNPSPHAEQGLRCSGEVTEILLLKKLQEFARLTLALIYFIFS